MKCISDTNLNLNAQTRLSSLALDLSVDLTLEECGHPVNADNVIRILKSHYDKKKALSTTQEDQAFVGSSQKKQDVCMCQLPEERLY
jgi:hypothetical protein